MQDDLKPGALDGLVVLDLSRILAGPTATQMLGDLGATVIKIENPRTGGDDTRAWGPPYIPLKDGAASDLSAYYLSANRNKLSAAADLTTEEGRALVRRIAAQADVVVENYKPGGLAKYGLDHETLLAAHPGLVYCSISGFGHTGPNRDQPGYDLMAQGYGGIMSLTGPVEGPPMKVGVAVADVVCGLYAATGILAALRHRDRTGEGQHIDLALVDSQMAWLINAGTNYLATGRVPARRGNAHPNIVPYEVFASADGHVIVACGNDSQFARLCAAFDAPALAADPAFATNAARVGNREALLAALTPLLAARSSADIVAALQAAGVPVGPINDLETALTSDQAEARGAVVEMASPDTEEGRVRLLGNPLKFSRTPVTYRHAPPRFGQDTAQVAANFPGPPADEP
ncbi:CAIB/BAIF family protein [Oceanicola granulosus HTCC2516]|uniref:CAIB/BAIF family protein n=1 Tax=Oceanicola granulosus (strain ATCC BAA-861 / DSM 15982 / KCTC 12143 / HTCC2516) TaxID=314256 RepID=Q2CIR4_OCEGH|nr:CoA transferase [Oceanicola granulosus]EAR52525.1 CAIB/BAIF family protein [Oceanicola granulosus HTCC2516]